ncbi:30S ribosomal protein S8e [Candidatus Woesearchaeota archaeon]|nr:30S ribosomal protein S8e [Candidatus Woesearchaeota archaeon]
MVLDQQRTKRKPSGGRLRWTTKKKKHSLGRDPTLTKIGDKAVAKIRVRGGAKKTRLLRTDAANLYDPKSKKYSKAKVILVTENPANRHYVRRNIMTKGTIIKTDKGMARVTSRPGQDGVLNAVLISEDKK